MQRTRDEIVRLLHAEGPSSAPALASRVGVSEGAVRRHMDIMLAEGLVETQLERHGRGRPAVRYSLSEAGEERTASGNYSRLLERLYPALARLPREAVSGEDGGAVLDQLFHVMAEDVAREYAPQVTGSELPLRVEQVAQALSNEGILSDVVDEGDSFRLLNVGCPYRSTAEGNHAACEADRLTIELLLDAPVRQVARAVEGSLTCEYLVAKQASPLAARPVEAASAAEGC